MEDSEHSCRCPFHDREFFFISRLGKYGPDRLICAACFAQIVSIASLDVDCPTRRAEIGQTLNMTVSVHTSFDWATEQALEAIDGSGQRMMYDVSCETDSWLITGPKRGEYVAKVSSDHQLRENVRR
jgi:hypothetical protein